MKAGTFLTLFIKQAGSVKSQGPTGRRPYKQSLFVVIMTTHKMEVKKRTQIATWQQETRQHALSEVGTMKAIASKRFHAQHVQMWIHLLEHTGGGGVSLKKSEALALGLIQARPCLSRTFPWGPLIPVC